MPQSSTRPTRQSKPTSAHPRPSPTTNSSLESFPSSRNKSTAAPSTSKASSTPTSKPLPPSTPTHSHPLTPPPLHSHHDHAGGNNEVLKHHKLPIIGGKDCASVTTTPSHNSTFTLGSGITVRALHTPCHTQDSICYLFEDSGSNERAVFTGDTLFIGGCGRFFEGTPEEMHKALNTTLAALPEDTKVYVSACTSRLVWTLTSACV